MKGLLDSEASFEAHATIDAGMWMMCQITNKNGGKWDFDTGAGTQFLFGEDDAEQVIIIMKDIASAKRYIGLDTKDEYEVIKLAKSMLPVYNTGDILICTNESELSLFFTIGLSYKLLEQIDKDIIRIQTDTGGLNIRKDSISRYFKKQ